MRSGLERGRGSVGDMSVGVGGGGGVSAPGGAGSGVEASGGGSSSGQSQPSAHVIHAMRGFFRSIALGQNEPMANVLQVWWHFTGSVIFALNSVFVFADDTQVVHVFFSPFFFVLYFSQDGWFTVHR